MTKSNLRKGVENGSRMDAGFTTLRTCPTATYGMAPFTNVGEEAMELAPAELVPTASDTAAGPRL